MFVSQSDQRMITVLTWTWGALGAVFLLVMVYNMWVGGDWWLLLVPLAADGYLLHRLYRVKREGSVDV